MNRLLIPAMVVGTVVLTCAASRTAMAAETRDTKGKPRIGGLTK